MGLQCALLQAPPLDQSQRVKPSQRDEAGVDRDSSRVFEVYGRKRLDQSMSSYEILRTVFDQSQRGLERLRSGDAQERVKT